MKNTVKMVQELFNFMENRIFLFPRFNEKVILNLNDFIKKGIFSEEEKALLNEFTKESAKLVTAINCVMQFGHKTDLETLKSNLKLYEQKIVPLIKSKVSMVA